MNVPEVAEKINELYKSLREISTSPVEIAEKINSILILGDGVPSDLLSAAWDQFAEQRGVKNG